jgi:hypothetical protein
VHRIGQGQTQAVYIQIAQRQVSARTSSKRKGGVGDERNLLGCDVQHDQRSLGGQRQLDSVDQLVRPEIKVIKSDVTLTATRASPVGRSLAAAHGLEIAHAHAPSLPHRVLWTDRTVSSRGGHVDETWRRRCISRGEGGDWGRLMWRGGHPLHC